jgi:hypothetical protein
MLPGGAGRLPGVAAGADATGAGGGAAGDVLLPQAVRKKQERSELVPTSKLNNVRGITSPVVIVIRTEKPREASMLVVASTAVCLRYGFGF